jgi:two-component system, response regulator PdtaR
MTAPLSETKTYRVLIVDDETLVAMGLQAQLQKLGHTVVGQAHNSAEAIALFRQFMPDLLVMDIRLGEDDGIRLAGELLQINRVPCVIVSAFSDDAMINRASEAGVFGYLIKPVSTESLAAQIAIAVRRFSDQQKLMEEKQQLLETLEARKLIERAKGIFMRRLKLDEGEAHRKLQLESQNRRISMSDLAKKVIDSEELLGS